MGKNNLWSKFLQQLTRGEKSEPFMNTHWWDTGNLPHLPEYTWWRPLISSGLLLINLFDSDITICLHIRLCLSYRRRTLDEWYQLGFLSLRNFQKSREAFYRPLTPIPQKIFCVHKGQESLHGWSTVLKYQVLL